MRCFLLIADYSIAKVQVDTKHVSGTWVAFNSEGPLVAWRSLEWHLKITWELDSFRAFRALRYWEHLEHLSTQGEKTRRTLRLFDITRPRLIASSHFLLRSTGDSQWISLKVSNSSFWCRKRFLSFTSTWFRRLCFSINDIITVKMSISQV